MNTKLEELFNLAPIKEQSENPVKNTEEMLEVMKNTQADIDKIDAALPQVVGLEASEKEMDRIRKKHNRYDEEVDLIRKLAGMAK